LWNTEGFEMRNVMLANSDPFVGENSVAADVVASQRDDSAFIFEALIVTTQKKATRNFNAGVLAALFLFAHTLPVYGQDANRLELEDDRLMEEVIVTSSATRLTSGFESPKPTTTIDAAAIDARGSANIADIINELPAFVGSTTPSSTTLNGLLSGANNLNLRNLGTNRSLVLIDKRRLVANTNFLGGGVNINTIPQMLIKQVEVVTGGASAQWGSDAIGGVINLTMDRHLEGGKFQLRSGQTSQNDSKDMSGSFAYGFSFADGRGHFTIGGDYQDNKGILAQADRDWSAESWGVVNNPLDTGPNDGIPARIVTNDVLLGFGTPGGYLPIVFNNPAVANIYFGPGGEILPYDVGRFGIPGAFATLPFQVGGSGGSLGLTTDLQTPLERKSLTVLFDFEIADDLNFFFDLSYADSETVHQTVQPWNFIGGGPDVIFADNPFIPAELQQIMTDNGVPALVMGRTNEDHGFITDTSTFETIRLATGLQGSFSDWSWEAYYTYGETDSRAEGANNPITQRRLLSVDAVRDPVSGEIVCRANAGGANGAPGCVPANLFGQGSPSQAALDYFMGTSIIIGNVKQHVFSASMNGEIFDLPAGRVAIAFGLEYREEKGATDYDDIAAAGGFFILNGTSLAGSFNVKEAFVEVGIPVFATTGGVSLDVHSAVRYADYTSSGSVVAWQLGTSLSLTDDFTLRGTSSLDIRAPNINDLFAAGFETFNNITNPATGDVTLATIFNGGNPDLDEERGETITLGVVWQPSAAPGLGMSVDYFKTEIEDAISTLPSQTIVDNCFALDAGCGNVTTVGGLITGVDATSFNIAQLTVEGIDFEASYNIADVAGGSLRFRLLASNYMEVSFSPDGMTTFDDAGVVGMDSLGDVATPKWRGNLSVNWAKDGLDLTAQVVYIGGGELINDLGPEDIDDNSVRSQTLVNLGIRYDIPFKNERYLQLFAGIDNVFDQDPPIAPFDFVSNLSTNTTLYNVIGRSYYGGIRFEF